MPEAVLRKNNNYIYVQGNIKIDFIPDESKTNW
jgi:hypothetical protein